MICWEFGKRKKGFQPPPPDCKRLGTPCLPAATVYPHLFLILYLLLYTPIALIPFLTLSLLVGLVIHILSIRPGVLQPMLPTLLFGGHCCFGAFACCPATFYLICAVPLSVLHQILLQLVGHLRAANKHSIYHRTVYQ